MVSPASLVPTLSPTPGAPFTVTVSSAVDQTYSFNVAAVGTDPNSIAHSILLAFTSTGNGTGSGFSFTLTPNPGFESLPAGQPAIYDLDVAPTGGTFPNNVALAASNNCPALSTCAFSTTLVSKGSGDTHITFTITDRTRSCCDAQDACSLRLVVFIAWVGGSVWRPETTRPAAKRTGNFLYGCTNLSWVVP